MLPANDTAENATSMSEHGIHVSGMVAVGKTALAKVIARRMNYQFLAEADLGLSYLPRLFEDPSRWGFEAQTAFLIGKASALMAVSGRGVSYVLDRSLEEDALIFFEYFRDRHGLDELTTRTYRDLYALFRRIVPPPTVSIICTASYGKVTERIKTRTKFNSYVPGYVESIFERYSEYIESKRSLPNTFICDGDRYDWTDDLICDSIALDIQKIIYTDSSDHAEPLNILRPHE